MIPNDTQPHLSSVAKFFFFSEHVFITKLTVILDFKRFPRIELILLNSVPLKIEKSHKRKKSLPSIVVYIASSTKSCLNAGFVAVADKQLVHSASAEFQI